jgi:Zn-dependent protease with chaperone function
MIRAHNSHVPSMLSTKERERLRHPLERRVAIIVGVLAVILVVLILSFLFMGAEWLQSFPPVAQYKPKLDFILAAVLGAPMVAGYAIHRRRELAQEESIRVSPTQLPDVHRVLARHCGRLGIALPDLYLSDGVEHTTSFAWQRRQCIILSTHDFELFPAAFDDIVDFVIAREIGHICLGHTSFANELLESIVAPIPFLRGPLSQFRTYSCDRYGAFLAPSAIRAVIVVATGDRLRDHVSLDAYLAQLDEGIAEGWVTRLLGLTRKRVPLAHRVLELRRAGLLTKV